MFFHGAGAGPDYSFQPPCAGGFRQRGLGPEGNDSSEAAGDLQTNNTGQEAGGGGVLLLVDRLLLVRN